MKRKTSIVMTILVCSVRFWVQVVNVGISETPILNAEQYLMVGTRFHQELTNRTQRKAAIRLINRFDSGLKRLSLAEMARQLRHWVSIRSHMRIETIEDVIASNLIGVLVNDIASHAMLDLTFSAYLNQGKAIQLDQRSNRLFHDIEQSCARNFTLSILLRPHILRILGTTDDMEVVFREIVQQAENRSRELYTEKRGHNPLAMSRIDQKSSKGLKSLCEYAFYRWKDIVKEPTAFPAQAYFVTVDLYIAQSFFEIHALLTRQGLTRNDDNKQEYKTYQHDMWYERFVQESKELADIRSIVTVDKSWFESRNTLLLLEEE